MIDFDRAIATGIGSWPGEDMPQALKMIFAESADLPYLAELPARGAPAGMIGRAAAVLAGLSVDLQPAGWRLTDAPGLDARRARSLWRADLDHLEEAAQGYAGPYKIAVAGPWTLAASVERPRGDRVLADHGARRELGQSLAEGLSQLLGELARRLPALEFVLQLDEPMLPAVLAGAIPTASGFSRHRVVEQNEVIETFRGLLEAVAPVVPAPATLVHCCSVGPPFELLQTAGFGGTAVDLARLRRSDWDQIAGLLEAEKTFGAGAVPTDVPVETSDSRFVDRIVDRVLTPVRRLGVDPDLSRRIWLTPACGLAAVSEATAVRVHRGLRSAAALLGERLAE